MNYYITTIMKDINNTISSSNKGFTSKDAAYSYLYSRIGGLLGRDDIVKVSIELIDENCIQYERLTYTKSELLASLNEQNAAEQTENPDGK